MCEHICYAVFNDHAFTQIALCTSLADSARKLVYTSIRGKNIPVLYIQIKVYLPKPEVATIPVDKYTI